MRSGTILKMCHQGLRQINVATPPISTTTQVSNGFDVAFPKLEQFLDVAGFGESALKNVYEVIRRREVSLPVNRMEYPRSLVGCLIFGLAPADAIPF